jgi:hypothetical protein
MKKFTDSVRDTEKKVETLSKPVTGNAHKKIIKLPDFINTPDSENVSLSTLVTTSLTNIENPTDFQNEYLYSTTSEISTGTGNYEVINVKDILGTDCEDWYMLDVSAEEANTIMYFDFVKPAEFTQLLANVKVLKETESGFIEQQREVEGLDSTTLRVYFILPEGLYYIGFNSSTYTYTLDSLDEVRERIYGHTKGTTRFYFEEDTTFDLLSIDGVGRDYTGDFIPNVQGDPSLKYVDVSDTQDYYDIIPNYNTKAMYYEGDFGLYPLEKIDGYYHAVPGTSQIYVFVTDTIADCSSTTYRLLLKDTSTGTFEWSTEYTWGTESNGLSAAYKIFSNTAYFTDYPNGKAFPNGEETTHIPGKEIWGFHITYPGSLDDTRIRVYGERTMITTGLELYNTTTYETIDEDTSIHLSAGLSWLKARDTDTSRGKEFILPLNRNADLNNNDFTISRNFTATDLDSPDGFLNQMVIKSYDYLGDPAKTTETINFTGSIEKEIDLTNNFKVVEISFTYDAQVCFLPFHSQEHNTSSSFRSLAYATDGKAIGTHYWLPMNTSLGKIYYNYYAPQSKASGSIWSSTSQNYEATFDEPVVIYGYGPGDIGYTGGASYSPNLSIRDYAQESLNINEFLIEDYVSFGPSTQDSITWEKTLDVSTYFSESASLHWDEYGFEGEDISSPIIQAYVSYSSDNITWSDEYSTSNHSLLPGLADHGEIQYIRIRLEAAADPTTNGTLFTDNHYIKDIKLEYYTWADLSTV